jgi:hypothetical protein
MSATNTVIGDMMEEVFEPCVEPYQESFHSISVNCFGLPSIKANRNVIHDPEPCEGGKGLVTHFFLSIDA